MLAALEISLVFWAVAVYATISGQQVAKDLAADLPSQPSVVVYSKTSLGLTTPSVMTVRLTDDGDPYRYQYSQLRLLLYSGGQYFLVPDNWEQGRDPVILLDDDSSIRIEFYSGP